VRRVDEAVVERATEPVADQEQNKIVIEKTQQDLGLLYRS